MSIQWGRVLLAAFLMELVLFANALKVVGAAAGGMMLAQRRQAANSNPGHTI
jgi:hypothetical protein